MSEFSESFHSQIEQLSSAGILSKTGVGRFNSLIEKLASHLDIPEDQIYVVSCARPNNLNIRLTQGRSQQKHNALGLGVLPNAGDFEKTVASGLTAGANFIGEGNARYDAVGIVLRDAEGKWVIGGIVQAGQSPIAQSFEADFPNMTVRSITVPAPNAEKVVPAPVPGSSKPALKAVEPQDISTMVSAFSKALSSTNLIFSDELIIRFVASLLARRFLILTGLSGSGKTKLAEAFARWLTKADDIPGYKIIPVGADWTSSEEVIGYPDALNPTRYETRPALGLLLKASQKGSDGVPHILILDEMNLSHVERYFSEFLSAMETGSPIELYSGDTRQSIPATVELPNNLFVIGTVNVDETTYLFSPKVLDRANVLEFRADEDEVFSFLESFGAVGLAALDGQGEAYAQAFVEAAKTEPQFDGADKDAVADAFRRIFRVMSLFGREFGFRTLRDVGRYVHFHHLLVGKGAWDVDWAIDAQIYQRVLPRLHGSRPQMQQLIWALGWICISDALTDGRFESEVVNSLTQDAILKNPFEVPENEPVIAGEFATAKYPLSCEKLYRMNRKLREGFVSFMEA